MAALTRPSVVVVRRESLRPVGPAQLGAMQEVLAAGIASAGPAYHIHPGDLAWWIFHDDPRYPGHLEFWLAPGEGVLVLDLRTDEINAFATPGNSVIPLIEFAQERLGGHGQVGWVSEDDDTLVSYLGSHGYEKVATDRSYRWDLRALAPPRIEIPPRWEVRHMRGEEEADLRRQASHAAFESTMDPALHMQRYLDFMRSPVYDLERDLVVVAPDGRIAAFMVWWADPSGIAQIEPFGTHPDFQRRGFGRLLLHFGLVRMSQAGMHTVRVCTQDFRPATGFYTAAGFTDVGGLHWWEAPQ